MEDWLVRLEEGPHRCAAIFVDNSGMDVILGVLPFARELLNRGTKVKQCTPPLFILYSNIFFTHHRRLPRSSPFRLLFFFIRIQLNHFCHDDTVEEPSGTNVTRRLANLAVGSKPESEGSESES